MVLTSICIWRKRESATDPLTIAVEKWENNLQKAKCPQDHLPFLLSNLEFAGKARILYKVATRKGLPYHLFQHPDDAEKIGCQCQPAGQSELTRLLCIFGLEIKSRIGTYATGSGGNVPAAEAAVRNRTHGVPGDNDYDEELDKLETFFAEKDNTYARRLLRAYIWGMDVLNEIVDEEESG
ncbi:uncharacterized protein P174DRAFT_515339 [Aspergillus novofumigatus IBT 16806]|uniref:Uncharacterized protein n=1 Tax=Aspergillus novofumigatus (strain IBT 16806) TaxID=1392255 RepID=A0A2I1BXS8_ASPN1|nr:uncharacterized protein P174DRAFT_515339 [Aspergillus novofumigatus IBT 16806]PKX90178.1 hypothetical protein P174DRAFT_515339 [Aspergillus novofumigatus IBT 16806]